MTPLLTPRSPRLSVTTYLRMLARSYARSWQRFFCPGGTGVPARSCSAAASAKAQRAIPFRAAAPIFPSSEGDTEVAAARKDAGATGTDAGAAISLAAVGQVSNLPRASHLPPPVLLGPGGEYQTPWPAVSAGPLDVTEDSQ